MSNDDVVIKVEHVSKDFVLPHEKTTSVKGVFTNIYRRSKKTKELQHALNDISFEIKRGEFFGIVGRNGSGKSTLLKILAGIYQPSKGSVATHGKLVPFIELGVGFNPELTGRENVYLNGAMLGFSEKEVEDMYDSIVTFAELEQFMDKKLKNYSSGMQVRLAFSMAIRAEADILLIDEVLAVGDADFQRKCYRFFEELKSNKKTVVFVSHDMGAIQQFCDKAVLIEKNNLVLAGDTLEVADAYTKMFTRKLKVDDATEGDEQTTRYGDGEIQFTHVATKITGDKNETLTIETTFKSKRHVRRPKLGFAVKNYEGTVIFGTNTDVARSEIAELEAGDIVKTVWHMPNVLNDGVYTIDVAASYEGTVADWWEAATTIDVTNNKKTPFVVNPPAEFSYVKSKKD